MIPQADLRGLGGTGVAHPRRPNPGVGDLHEPGTTAAQRNCDVAERSPMKTDARRLVVLGTADVAELVLRSLLEPFDSKLVEVRNHGEHFNMELLQREKRAMAK